MTLTVIGMGKAAIARDDVDWLALDRFDHGSVPGHEDSPSLRIALELSTRTNRKERCGLASGAPRVKLSIHSLDRSRCELTVCGSIVE